jgi:hypothetical protein
MRLLAPPGTTDADRRVFALLNRLFADLRQDVDALKERPAFSGNIDMQGFRITNVGASRAQGDVANRGELEDKALFENANKQHIANSSIIAKDGVRSERQARQANELVPLHQVKELITNAVAGPTPSAGTSFTFTALPLVNGDNNDIVLSGGSAYRITGPTAPFVVTGLHIGATIANLSPDGSYVILFNGTGSAMTVAHNSSAAGQLSLPHNRINTVSGMAGIVTTGSGVATFLYDGSSSKWIVVGVVL